MSLLFTILITITCLLLVLIILVQNPKGGGLSSTFGGGNPQMFGGVKKTGDFLDKATWTLAIVLFALVMLVNMIGTSDEIGGADGSVIDEVETSTPALPTNIPTTTDQAQFPETVEDETEE